MTEKLPVREPGQRGALQLADLAVLARVRDRLPQAIDRCQLPHAIDRDEPFRGLSILDLEAKWIAAGWQLPGKPGGK